MELTRREMEIARMAAGGAPPRSIAARMSLSLRTIESALLVICTKLGIATLDELEQALRSRQQGP
ncbi:MAG TPA: helix-turn-helix transcriptional regulator [Candidatus Baltobacteraceae bacterium]|nr:helix-turn-helix transcriptional regulator [Candidatus Baltobacteraceae bacterium]